MYEPTGDNKAIKVFVGGPILYAMQNEVEFNQRLKDTILLVIGKLTDMGCQVYSAHVAEKFGIDTKQFTPEAIYERDFGWMQGCDVFVPVLLSEGAGRPIRTDGTFIEIGWASALGKPVLALLEIAEPISGQSGFSDLFKGLLKGDKARYFCLDDLENKSDILADYIKEMISENVASK